MALLQMYFIAYPNSPIKAYSYDISSEILNKLKASDKLQQHFKTKNLLFSYDVTSKPTSTARVYIFWDIRPYSPWKVNRRFGGRISKQTCKQAELRLPSASCLLLAWFIFRH
jgi:hypothetical protein